MRGFDAIALSRCNAEEDRHKLVVLAGYLQPTIRAPTAFT